MGEIKTFEINDLHLQMIEGNLKNKKVFLKSKFQNIEAIITAQDGIDKAFFNVIDINDKKARYKITIEKIEGQWLR